MSFQADKQQLDKLVLSAREILGEKAGDDNNIHQFLQQGYFEVAKTGRERDWQEQYLSDMNRVLSKISGNLVLIEQIQRSCNVMLDLFKSELNLVEKTDEMRIKNFSHEKYRNLITINNALQEQLKITVQCVQKAQQVSLDCFRSE